MFKKYKSQYLNIDKNFWLLHLLQQKQRTQTKLQFACENCLKLCKKLYFKYCTLIYDYYMISSKSNMRNNGKMAILSLRLIHLIIEPSSLDDKISFLNFY